MKKFSKTFLQVNQFTSLVIPSVKCIFHFHEIQEIIFNAQINNQHINITMDRVLNVVDKYTQ